MLDLFTLETFWGVKKCGNVKRKVNISGDVVCCLVSSQKANVSDELQIIYFNWQCGFQIDEQPWKECIKINDY